MNTNPEYQRPERPIQVTAVCILSTIMALFFVGAGLWASAFMPGHSTVPPDVFAKLDFASSRGDIPMAMVFFTPGGLILIGVFRFVTGTPSGHMTLSVGVFGAMFVLVLLLLVFIMNADGGGVAFRMTALFTCLSVLCALLLLALRTSKVTRYVVDLKMYSIEEADRQDLDA